MALINCPECGKEVSDNSKKCIHCGYSLKKTKKTSILVVVGIIAVIIVLTITIVILITTIKSNPKATETCKIESCSNKVYTNGYCIEHYGNIRAGNADTPNTANATSNEGFPEDDSENTVSFSKDSKISTETCEFTLIGYSIADKIEPSNCQSNYYHYFEASSGNVFIDVKFSIKNLGKTAVAQSNILSSVKILYDGDYEYACSFVTVDADGDFENFTSLNSINPLETMEYHMLAEVPNEVKRSSKGLVVRVNVDGTAYECTLR